MYFQNPKEIEQEYFKDTSNMRFQSLVLHRLTAFNPPKSNSQVTENEIEYLVHTQFQDKPRQVKLSIYNGN